MELEKDLEGNSEYENLSNTEKNEIENNNEPLLKLDFNALANAKKIAQQDISDEDNWENISDTESETEYNKEHDEIINKLQDDENLSPCVIIDIFNGEIQ